MQCSICKEKAATIHLTDIMGDKVRKSDLCEDCAKNKGVDESTFKMVDLPGDGAAYATAVWDAKNLPGLKAAFTKAFERPSQN